MSTGIMMISNYSSRNADSYPSEKSLVYGLCRVGTSLTWVYLDSLLSLRVNLSLLKPSPPTWPTSFSSLLANFPRNPGIKLVSAEGGLVGKAIPAPRAGYKELWNDWQLRIVTASGWFLLSLWGLCPKSNRCLSTLCDALAGLDSC